MVRPKVPHWNFFGRSWGKEKTCQTKGTPGLVKVTSMTSCKHEFYWQGRNPGPDGVNRELWDFCRLCGHEQQRHIVKIEPLKDGHSWEWDYRAWEQCGYYPDTSVPMELWKVCKRCKREQLVYTRTENRFYPLGTDKEKKFDLLLEYLCRET